MGSCVSSGISLSAFEDGEPKDDEDDAQDADNDANNDEDNQPGFCYPGLGEPYFER